jgi:hypothetical protein
LLGGPGERPRAVGLVDDFEVVDDAARALDDCGDLVVVAGEVPDPALARARIDAGLAAFQRNVVTPAEIEQHGQRILLGELHVIVEPVPQRGPDPRVVERAQ